MFEEDYSDSFNTEETNSTKSVDDILNSVDISNGLVTRQYLFEKITEYLVNITPKFDFVRQLNESSEEFGAWAAIVKNSAEILKKGNKEDMPYLVSAKDKLFYIMLEVKRVKWLSNIDNFVTEIVNIAKFDTETGKMDETVYGLGYGVGDKIYIKIMKGETAMVSVKDAYVDIKDEILNPKNYMPIVLGIDAEGQVVWRDFKSLNSILVTGMPRSGKSWFVQCILSQMMFYLSPSELEFYIQA